jgi:hypothetical protein
MKEVKTYRKHTATAIVAAAVKKPQWTRGGNLVAEMPDGDIAIHVVHPSESNGYSTEIILLNCFSIHAPCASFGAGVVCMAIGAGDLEELEEIEGKMWEDLNA